jgi:hypothetical protein
MSIWVKPPGGISSINSESSLKVGGVDIPSQLGHFFYILFVEQNAHLGSSATMPDCKLWYFKQGV